MLLRKKKASRGKSTHAPQANMSWAISELSAIRSQVSQVVIKLKRRTIERRDTVNAKAQIAEKDDDEGDIECVVHLSEVEKEEITGEYSGTLAK